MRQGVVSTIEERRPVIRWTEEDLNWDNETESRESGVDPEKRKQNGRGLGAPKRCGVGGKRQVKDISQAFSSTDMDKACSTSHHYLYFGEGSWGEFWSSWHSMSAAILTWNQGILIAELGLSPVPAHVQVWMQRESIPWNKRVALDWFIISSPSSTLTSWEPIRWVLVVPNPILNNNVRVSIGPRTS